MAQETGMDTTDSEQHADARVIIDVLTGTWRAQVLHAAAAMGIPDLIAAGRTRLDDLAKETGADATRIGRLMRVLVAMGVVDRDPADPDGYRLTGVGHLLRRDVPESMRDLVLVYGEEFHRAWGSFCQAITTGLPGFQHAFGMRLHDYLARSQEAAARFQAAMNAGSIFFATMPQVFDFSTCRTVVDVAGGNGALLAAVLHASPHSRGVLCERPGVTEIARRKLAEAFPPERFEVVETDIFTHVPPRADAYLLSRILQDWDDDACVTLLRNISSGMSSATRLLILERVVPDEVPVDGTGQLPLLYDLHLLNMAGGGQRTMTAYRSLLDKAGLSAVATHELPLEMTLLVAVRA